MQILRGKGRIYDSNKNYIDEVTYDIYHQSPTESTVGKWWGEVTPNKGIILAGNYIIELDDGRKGPCILNIKTTSSFELVIDTYNLEGNGPLTL